MNLQVPLIMEAMVVFLASHSFLSVRLIAYSMVEDHKGVLPPRVIDDCLAMISPPPGQHSG